MKLIKENINNLNEHYINIIDNIDKKILYLDIVCDLLEKTYNPLGGFKSISNKDELLEDNILWKLVKRNNKIIAVALYKNTIVGRKAFGFGSDLSTDGKKEIIKIVDDDIKTGRSFVEVSGKPERYLFSKNYLPIPNNIAKEILIKLNKHVVSLNNDGFHYSRYINGELIEKVMFGKTK